MKDYRECEFNIFTDFSRLLKHMEKGFSGLGKSENIEKDERRYNSLGHKYCFNKLVETIKVFGEGN